MFSSNPLDKNCVGSDNFSSGRNNATRFPVGMTSLGDENQHIRIQLAVHKYNSSPNGQLSSRTSVISPVRHSFLKNSLKAKNFEGDSERTSKSEKNNGNKYEGVGAFPTIHLRKSAVRYRPIRRFNDVKIPYPELPVNRFLSNLPEVNSESKSSARSVLDVLEDLSGKKIHSNEENKPKNKGLGGDYLLNQSAVYKPLFVQKPKVGTILTRDNTTQTLSQVDTETSSPQSNNSFIKNDAADPKAELRRKLAKQNNEIFASLSSSISSSFAIKRKIDKALRTKDDDHATEGSASKKSKMSDLQPKNHTGNGDSGISKAKVKSPESLKLSRKSKINETSTPTSPNKDRLTTIFLDMRNTSLKAQIFENNATSTETSGKKPNENGAGAESSLSNGFVSSPVNTYEKEASSKTTGIQQNTTENDVKNSNVNKKFDTPDGDRKKEESEGSKPTFNFPVNKPSSPVQLSVPSGFQFSGSNTSSFTFQKTADSSETSKNTESNIEKDNVQTVTKPFTSGSKPDFSSFKFGAEGIGSPAKDLEPPKPQISEPAVTAPSAMTQFNFGTTATIAITASLPSTVSFGVPITQNTTVFKPMFTFGQNAALSQMTAKDEEKVKSSNVMSTSTTQSIQPSGFSFGQKNAEPSAEISQQTTSAPSAPISNTTTFSATAAAVSTDSATGIQNGKSLFTFGQKAETSTISSGLVTVSQEQKFGFSFGQKPDTVETHTVQSKPESFGQKSSSLFFFGQRPTTQESSQSTNAITSITSPSQPPTAQTTSPFGQSTLQPTSTSTFAQSTTPQPASLVAKSEAESLSSGTTPAVTQSGADFPVRAPLFTPSGSVFGTATTQVSTTFGTISTSASSFKFGTSTTTQSQATFGVSSAPQTIPVFGASSTSQSLAGFGNSTTQTSFGAPVSNSTSTFGVSRQPSFTFGIASTTQTTPSFGVTSTTQTTPTFGTSASQSTTSFGIPSTTQSTSAFGASSTSLSTTGFGTTSTTQSTPAFGSSGFGAPSSQPSTAFGAPASTQSGLQFGSPTVQNNNNFGTGFSTASSTIPSNTFGASTATSTSGFGTSQSSFSQPFGSKLPATSLGQQTSSIFGQNPVPSFSSNTAFSSNQNNVFGQKSNTGGNIFDQNKIHSPGFGAATQPFGTQNKFSFGMSTSNATGFTTSPPNTTAAPIFSFGGNSAGNTFTFGSTSSGSANTQTPFAFKTPTNEPFKFGASTTKEGPGFGAASPSTFAFSGQMNNNAIAEQKPAFNFGNTQVSSSSPFNFGTTPSPSVFSFGGSSSSASSGSTFNFGTPTPGGPFGQTPSASPGAPFAVPGTFSIGSGSSQSRPRATSRPRRRP